MSILCTTVAVLLLATCSPPDDSSPIDIIGSNFCVDEWRDDTARIQTTIRFEALVDTTQFHIERFSGSGLRIAVVCIPPLGDTLPYRDIYSVSANYLDIPAAGLPFQAEIPPAYFQQYDCARLAAAVILVYRDQDADNRYDPGEPVYGADEQSLYAFVQGDLNTVPRVPFESVFQYSNVLIRHDREERSYFQSSPDYLATIFIINVRGELGPYDLPYPWHVSSPLLP
ncbi:MAG: hypothetical protein JXA28_04310 [Bacteroidetes bacterium]|nr:hypothetical protein [Bacteroidota bacterium]